MRGVVAPDRLPGRLETRRERGSIALEVPADSGAGSSVSATADDLRVAMVTVPTTAAAPGGSGHEARRLPLFAPIRYRRGR